MTADLIAVLKAAPHSDAISEPSWRIAEKLRTDPTRTTTRLLILAEMGLVEVVHGERGRWFSRTPKGDAEARRARA